MDSVLYLAIYDTNHRNGGIDSERISGRAIVDNIPNLFYENGPAPAGIIQQAAKTRHQLRVKPNTAQAH